MELEEILKTSWGKLAWVDIKIPYSQFIKWKKYKFNENVNI